MKFKNMNNDRNSMNKGIELTDEELDKIAGGELDALQIWALRTQMGTYKDQGKSLEDFTTYLERDISRDSTYKGQVVLKGNPQTAADAVSWARQNW